jgi:hypothetical protein
MKPACRCICAWAAIRSRWLVACLIAAALVLPGLRAYAGTTVVIPDPMTSPEHEELAVAVAFLVRSTLEASQHSPTPRRELALALEALTGRVPGRTLAVSSELAPKVLARLGAEAIVTWDLRVGAKGTTVTGVLTGSGGRRLARVFGTAATGDVAELARQLEKRLAPAIGATIQATPDVGLADLRPYLSAQAALVVGDPVAAARSVDMALPSVATRVGGAKAVMRLIAADPSLPALPRTHALLLMGDFKAAAARADAGLAVDSRSIALRAAKIRALAGLGDLSGAEQALQQIKNEASTPVVIAAALSLELRRGATQARLDEVLAPLMGRPAAEWRPILPLLASSAPGTFSARVEAGALAAAEKMIGQEPGLAATLAARALASGIGATKAAPLINVQDLSAQQIRAVGLHLAGEADSAAIDLSRKIRAREEEAKEAEQAAGPERPTGAPSTLANTLRPTLQGFAALYDPNLTSIQVAPLPGSGQPFYWPYLVRPQRLSEGLLEALMRSPWELNATRVKLPTDALPPERFTEEGMVNLAQDLGGGLIMFYRVRPAGFAPWVNLELVLYDSAKQRADRIETALIGRATSLVMLNPLLVIAAIVAGLAIIGWLILLSLRGTVVVRVQWDADAKDELFSILISRSPHTPSIENIGAYRKKLEWIGKRKRRFEAWNIDQNTAFRGIPRGKWYVHLYGIYTRGRQTMMLREPPQEVEVLARKTVFVAHVLEAAEAEFKVIVLDDHGAVEGARVWADDQRARAVPTAKDGSVTLKVVKGYHVIHVNARGMTIDRPYHVVKAKVHEMTINLVWERRQEFVSRALERQVDDAAVYMTKAPKRSDAATAPAEPAPPVVVPGVVEGMPVAAGNAPSPPGGIEIRLEDTPIVDLLPPPRQDGPAAGTGPSSPKLPTLSLKPLAPQPARAAASENRGPGPAPRTANTQARPEAASLELNIAMDDQVASSERAAPAPATRAPLSASPLELAQTVPPQSRPKKPGQT